MAADPQILQDFAQSLSTKDPKTVSAYLSALRGFRQWPATKPGGDPFTSEAVTATAVNSYLNHLKAEGRAPRTPSQVLTALSRFCRWAIGKGYMTHNPVSQVTRPTVVNTAPRELTPEQRYVLKNRVEAEHSPRQAAIFALGYWAGLRISEVAQLRLEHCQVNRRSGQITIVDSKGGKTRTIDLHNEVQRALYNYINEAD